MVVVPRPTRANHAPNTHAHPTQRNHQPQPKQLKCIFLSPVTIVWSPSTTICSQYCVACGDSGCVYAFLPVFGRALSGRGDKRPPISGDTDSRARHNGQRRRRRRKEKERKRRKEKGLREKERKKEKKREATRDNTKKKKKK